MRQKPTKPSGSSIARRASPVFNRLRSAVPIGLAAVISVFVFVTDALAVPTTVPTGLAPGTQYRLAFVTSTVRNATSANISDYNAFVSAAANAVSELAALGTGWTAIASTTTVDARDNTSTSQAPAGPNGVAIYLMNDVKLADHYDDLWDGTIDSVLGIDENGNAVGGDTRVWTGTTFFGTATATSALGVPTTEVTHGRTTFSSAAWVTGQTLAKSNQLHLYGISDILTVQEDVVLSEPGALPLVLFSLITMVMVSRQARL